MALNIVIRAAFDDAARRRAQYYEGQWLKDLRQYKGIYDPEIKAKLDPKRSKAFIRETRTKIRTLDARLMDLLFPANGEKNWGIEETPVPTIPPQVKEVLIKNIQATLVENGEQRAPTEDEYLIAEKEYVKLTTNNMENEIHDQLSEIKYRDSIKNCVHSGHLYGTGWLKGPLVDQAEVTSWQYATSVDQQTQQSIGQWQLVKRYESRPYAEFKPIWDVYPDMSVVNLSDCRYVIERHIMPKHKVRMLALRPDFLGAQITEYLTANINGNFSSASFENELYSLDDNSTVDRTASGNYELIEYWGYVSSDELVNFDQETYAQMLGNQVTDIPVNIWLLGDRVIKVAIDPLKGITIPYYIYYFDKDETSIYGEGVASVIRHPQALTNASIRALIDNAAHCAGPQYEVNMDLLEDGEDPSDIGAFKVWLRRGRDADIAGKEAIRIKQLVSYTPEFTNMYSLFSRITDEVATIPRYMQGDARVSGAARTQGGLSMLIGQANIGLSDLVKTFDEGITKPFVSNMYHWNMVFNLKESIKGDMKIVARGSTALIAKEVRAQQIQMFLQMTLNPMDAGWVKRGSLLREWAKSSDITPESAVRTDTEYDDWQKQQAVAAQTEQQGGAGFNQLESVIKQVEEGMAMIAEKVSTVEQVVAAMAQAMKRDKLTMIAGGQQ
jgi:hypothetical protein